MIFVAYDNGDRAWSDKSFKGNIVTPRAIHNSTRKTALLITGAKTTGLIILPCGKALIRNPNLNIKLKISTSELHVSKLTRKI